MRLLVTGGRDFQDYHTIRATLDRMHLETPITLLIHGAAKGADSLALSWAILNDIQTLAFPANWTQHGKAAGPLRNQQMLTEGHPDAYLAFTGGRGTQDMVSRCRKQGIKDILQKDAQPPCII